MVTVPLTYAQDIHVFSIRQNRYWQISKGGWSLKDEKVITTRKGDNKKDNAYWGISLVMTTSWCWNKNSPNRTPGDEWWFVPKQYEWIMKFNSFVTFAAVKLYFHANARFPFLCYNPDKSCYNFILEIFLCCLIGFGYSRKLLIDIE